MTTDIEALEEAETRAEIIREQIGRWTMMEHGVRDRYFSATVHLGFTMTADNRRALAVSIVLDPSDTYTVRWWPVALRDLTPARSVSGIYGDSFADILRGIARAPRTFGDLA